MARTMSNWRIIRIVAISSHTFLNQFEDLLVCGFGEEGLEVGEETVEGFLGRARTKARFVPQ